MAIALAVAGGVAVMPFALNRFLFLKLGLITVAAALMWAVPPRGRLPRPVVGLLSAGAAVLFIAAITGDQPLAQLIGRAPRYEGVLVLPVYVLSAIAGARLLGPEPGAPQRQTLIRTLAFATIAVAALALLEAMGARPLPSTSDRPGSLLGNASDQGAWSVLALGPLAAAALQDRHRWAIAGALAAAIGVVTSESRGALLGAAAVVVVLLVLAKARVQRAFLAGGLVAGAGAALLAPGFRDRIIGADSLARGTVSGRQQLWNESWHLIVGGSPLGSGPSGFADAIVTAHTPEWYQTVGPAYPPDSPHNWLLQALSAGGPALLGLAIAVVVILAMATLRARHGEGGLGVRTGAAAGLAGYGVALMFHFTTAGATTLAAFLAGFVLALPAPSVAGVPRTAVLNSRHAAAVATALLSVLLLAAALAEIPLRWAISSLERGATAEADGPFKAASALRPWDVDLDLMAGHAYAVLALEGDHVALRLGEPWLASAAARLPLSVDVMLDQASLAEAGRDLVVALGHISRAQERDPYNPNIKMTQGILLAQLKDYPAAESAFQEAARLAPDSPDPWRNLARLYEIQGLTDAADDARAQAAQR